MIILSTVQSTPKNETTNESHICPLIQLKNTNSHQYFPALGKKMSKTFPSLLCLFWYLQWFIKIIIRSLFCSLRRWNVWCIGFDFDHSIHSLFTHILLENNRKYIIYDAYQGYTNSASKQEYVMLVNQIKHKRTCQQYSNKFSSCVFSTRLETLFYYDVKPFFAQDNIAVSGRKSILMRTMHKTFGGNNGTA